MNKHNKSIPQISYHITTFIVPFFLLLFLLTGCAKDLAKDEKLFSSFSRECFIEFVSKDSVGLHFKLSDPSKYGLSGNTSVYSDISLKAQQEECDHAASLLGQLHSFDRSKLSKNQQLTYDIFERKLEQTVKSRDYLLYQSLLGSNGLPSQIPVSLSEYYFDNENDIKNYLALLSQLPQVFDQLIAFEQDRNDAGNYTAAFIIDNTINQIDQFLSGSEEDNLLIDTFEDRIRSVDGLSDDQKKTYINNNRALFKQVVIPSYQSLKNTLSSWKTASSQKERLAQHDKGKEYYQMLLASNVGTDKTPDECIAVLEKQLKDIIADIASLNASHPELYSDYLGAQPALSDPKEILSQLEADSFVDFPEIEAVACTLKELPASLSGTSAAAFYLVPPIDASDCNIIYINKNRIDDQDLFSTLAHEGYPGHLYQTNYYLEQNQDPIRYLLRTEGYDEGWGTYAQLYSYNYLEFQDVDKETTETLRQLYRDNDLLSLTLSSLSDLYVNYKNYDRKALSDYLSAFSIEEKNSSAIYEYVVENPTTYLTYCMGYYELIELRNTCEKQEGSGFDIQSFHKKVLDCGSCPFDLLSLRVKKGGR